MVSMSDTTVLNVKIDRKLKQQAQMTAQDLGLPVSTVVAVGLQDFVRRRSITISDSPRLRPEVERELLRLSREAKQGKNLSPAFHTADEAIAWLQNEITA